LLVHSLTLVATSIPALASNCGQRFGRIGSHGTTPASTWSAA
jgi:hypothetical protein